MNDIFSYNPPSKAVKVETINGYRIEFWSNGTASAKAIDNGSDGFGGPADWVVDKARFGFGRR